MAGGVRQARPLHPLMVMHRTLYANSVADPEFPVKGDTDPLGGPISDVVTFPQKCMRK